MISWPGDFTYLGAFKLDYAGLAGEHRYGRGLAFHDARGHLLSTYGTGSQKYGIYEFAPGTPLVGTGYSTGQYDVVAALKDYQHAPYTSEGVFLIGGDDLSGDNGVGWDDEEQVVPWAYSEGYGSNYGCVGYGSLDYASATGIGHGRFSTSHPAGFKSVSGGMAMVPAWYADAYLGGKRWAFGYGRNQSIVAQQDLSQGFTLSAVDKLTSATGNSLRLTDCATSGAGSTTLTSATGGFTAGMVGHRMLGSAAGSSWTGGTYVIQSVTNANAVVLDSSPTPGGAGSGGDFWLSEVVPSTPLVGFWPTTSAPDGSHGRSDRPDGESLFIQNLDSWPSGKWTWVDNVNGCAWIDTGTRHGVLFCGRYARDMASYLNSDVVASYYSHFMGVYDPMRFAPVTGSAYYEVQPDYLGDMRWPVVDYGPYGLGDAKAVTSITSNPAKAQSDPDGAVVACASHGFADNQSVRVAGSSVDEHDSFWRARLIDANSFHLQNTSAPSAWSGSAASNGGMTARALGENGIVDTIGMAFDHASKKLYVSQQVLDGPGGPDQLQVMVMVYQLNGG